MGVGFETLRTAAEMLSLIVLHGSAARSPQHPPVAPSGFHSENLTYMDYIFNYFHFFLSSLVTCRGGGGLSPKSCVHP